jgi:predicted regulator of Ras-like GTPase activity (Roadblock/LC7/MglB family)
MDTLPQLIEEDMAKLGAVLRDLLTKSEAATAFIADKGGFLITSQGNDRDYDLTTIAALASGAFMASQSIAGLMQENSFNSTFQQGKNYSIFIQSVDENCLLLVLFPAGVGVGAVKYFAGATAREIALQMQAARDRDPSAGLDLSVLNLADPSEVFKRRD